MHTICITPAAIDDIDVAIEYYNSLATDLGYRFADVINNYFERIAHSPPHLPFDIKTFVANLFTDFLFLLPIP